MSGGPRIALVGCARVGTWPVAASDADPRPWERDDRPLHAALAARGAEVHRPAWDDPAVRWDGFDLALIRATWDYHHRRDAFVAWAERAGAATRLVNPAEVVRWNSDKRYLRGLDAPQPPTAWPEGPDQLADAVAGRGWTRAIIKPVVGATAEGTLVFDVDDEGLARARAHVDALGAPVFVQAFVPEVGTLGERSAIAIGGAITHYVRKQPVPGDYRVQDDYGATDAPHEPSPAERGLAEQVVAGLPAGVEVARVDWLVGADGPALVELELIEPCLFFRHGPGAAERLADRVIALSRR